MHPVVLSRGGGGRRGEKGGGEGGEKGRGRFRAFLTPANPEGLVLDQFWTIVCLL